MKLSEINIGDTFNLYGWPTDVIFEKMQPNINYTQTHVDIKSNSNHFFRLEKNTEILPTLPS